MKYGILDLIWSIATLIKFKRIYSPVSSFNQNTRVVSYNLDKLKRLVSDDISAQISFVTLFIEEAENKEIPAINKALENKDLPVLLNKVHSLKSNVKFFGFDALSLGFQELEDELSSSSQLSIKLIDKLNEIVVELKEGIKELKGWLKENQKS